MLYLYVLFKKLYFVYFIEFIFHTFLNAKHTIYTNLITEKNK